MRELPPVQHWSGDGREWNLGEVPVRISWGYWATHACTSEVCFGTQMVDLHLHGDHADQVFQEMLRWGWADKYGDSPAVTLATVICHEVAHTITLLRYGYPHPQALGAPRGHGRRWRKIYTDLVTEHLEALAAKIASLGGKDLLESCGKATVVRKVAEARKARRKRTGNFRKGDRVEFVVRPWETLSLSKDEWVSGWIYRCTATRYRVVVDDPRWKYMRGTSFFRLGEELRRPQNNA